MSEWQPIETAPKDGTVILVYRYYVCAVRWNEKLDQDYPWEAMPIGAMYGPFEENGFMDGCPSMTHWMPLPPPPKES